MSRRRLTSLGVAANVARQIAVHAGSAAASVIDQGDARLTVKGDRGCWGGGGYENGLRI